MQLEWNQAVSHVRLCFMAISQDCKKMIRQGYLHFFDGKVHSVNRAIKQTQFHESEESVVTRFSLATVSLLLIAAQTTAATASREVCIFMRQH